MRGCWSVCSVFKALKWVSSSFFVIEEHLQTPKRHLREMVGLFKGDTSQCKLALLQYLQIEPQISQLEVRVNGEITGKNWAKTKNKV